MIELERHIEILLLSNDCVIVPDLGGFMAHHVDACYDEQEHLFLPPMRTLGFNPQLKMNDSLLVQSYIEAYDLSYPEALRRIEAEVSELRQYLETDGQYELNDIGLLRLNDDGKLEFEPCEAGILTPELYGLSSLDMPLLQQEAEAPASVASDINEAGQNELPADDNASQADTITIKMAWLRNLAATAAAILAFFLMTSPVENSSVEVQQSAFIPMPATVSPAEAEPKAKALTEATPEETVVTEPQYCLVLASQVSKNNADIFIKQLSAKGFNEARQLETKKMRRVVYGHYNSETEAYNSLRALRSESKFFAEAWILEVKED